MILPVYEDGVRPAGPTDKCFYCDCSKGSEHLQSCVMRHKLAVFEITVQYISIVPASWDEDQISFHRGESSFCLGNDIDQIYEESKAENGICNICRRTKVQFLREATYDDIDFLTPHKQEIKESHE